MDGTDIDAIAKTAEERLRSDGFLRSHKLTVTAEGNFVVIRGRVPSFYHKQMAQETIRGIVGMATIKNFVVVGE
jgi:osmotically-inducible protein OsmY